MEATLTTDESPDRAVLVGYYPADSELPPELLLDELASLVKAAGATSVGSIWQRRGVSRARQPGGATQTNRPLRAATYIGRGKAKMVAELVEAKQANVVVFDNELSPAQVRELERIIGCRVIDRSELILDIFAVRAKTAEARLQVEMAQLQYTAPRLRGMWSHLERQAGTAGTGGGGGVGLRGPGEKQIEIDRRIVGSRLKRLRDQLSKIQGRKEREVAGRSHEQFCVGLVGYTNAGKSTLMNALTTASTHTADALFATLDTKTRRWRIDAGLTVLLSDTVGFVRDLPHYLIASFSATLQEALNADLLLHVIDASHPQVQSQISTVEQTLELLDCPPDRLLPVLNKIDAVTDPETLPALYERLPAALSVSARNGDGIAQLTAQVAERRKAEWIKIRLRAPVGDGKLQAFVRSCCQLLSERFDDHHWTAEVELSPAVLARLRARPGDHQLTTLCSAQDG